MARMEDHNGYWHSVVERFEESGLSGAEFCRQNGLKPWQFYRWRKKVRGTEHGSSGGQGGFLRLIPSCDVGSSGIRIRLGGGILIEVEQGFDPTTLRRTIETLS